MYLRLKDILNEGCKKMPYAIFYFIDNDENKENNTYYRLFFDCFKNIELICHAIDIKAYTQAGTLLRSLIEQTSTLQVLLKNPSILNEYNRFSKLKLNLIMNKEKAKQDILNLKNSCKVKCGFINFCDFGWLEKLGETNFSIDTIVKKAHIGSLPVWRTYCNNFVHNSLSFTQLNDKGINYYIKNFIYISALLYDHLLCLFHNLNGFDFVFENINYREIFINHYKYVTEQRKLEDFAT